MRIDKPKRGRKANKRLDLTDLREVLRDRRQWAALGVVVGNADNSPYWRIEMSDDGNSAIDVLVDIVLQPGQERVTARLAAGMYIVPGLGEECAVLIPAGRVDFMPTIVGILSSNNVPNPSTDQAPDPTRIVLVRPTVLVHDGSGGAASLALKSDVKATDDKLNDLITKYNAHTHAVAVDLSGVTAGTDNVPGGGAGTASAVTTPETPVSDPVGTTVLLAK